MKVLIIYFIVSPFLFPVEIFSKFMKLFKPKPVQQIVDKDSSHEERVVLQQYAIPSHPTITLEEAIKQGYEYFVEDGCETFEELSRFFVGSAHRDQLLNQLNRGTKYWLIDKNKLHLTLSPDDICEQLCDFVDNQGEEFNDEDMELNGMINELNKDKPELFQNLADALNDKFKEKTFYNRLNIEVIFTLPKYVNDLVKCDGCGKEVPMTDAMDIWIVEDDKKYCIFCSKNRSNEKR